MKSKAKWYRLIQGFLIAFLIVLIIVGCYACFVNNQPWLDWTGFATRTLWDFLELLIVPAILAIGVHWFTDQRNKTEREIAKNRSLDAAVLAYLDDMTNFLLERNLRSSEAGSDIREIARAKSLAVFQGLDGKRKGILVRFLYQAKLILKDGLVLDLSGADLSNAMLNGNDESGNRDRTFMSYLSLADVQLFGTNLQYADFTEAKLSGASLTMADLSYANFTDAHLMMADLRCANLTNTNLKNANLMKADLSGVTGITEKQLAKTKALTGATLPDGSKHD